MGQFEAHGDYSTIANCYIKCSRYIWKAIWNFPWCFKIYNYFSTIPRGNPNDVLRNPQVTRKADWGEKKWSRPRTYEKPQTLCAPQTSVERQRSYFFRGCVFCTKKQTVIDSLINFIIVKLIFFVCVALQPNAGHGLLVFEVSRSHTTTHHIR